ncbi:MAG: phage replisome organizer N-terminal domain-containing protein [Clostridia bacterium]|nr:phage replisome organizer N-terminal domain-containing protein [Clostridia bacterium]
MDEVQWIKIYLDMFDRRKINKIRRLPAGNDILLFWVMLLVTAGKCNAGGMIFITERIPFTKEDLADEFDFEISTIELALKAFVEFDMISIDNKGFIEVRNWSKYQNTDRLAEIREQNRERKRLQRARQKQALLDESQDSHVTVTVCHDIEEEGEKDKEKESHSFVLCEEAKQKLLGGSLGKGVVMLSDEQIEDLLDKLSIEEFDKYVAAVAECELSGKHYKRKTHYKAILEMAEKDRRIK